MQLALYLDRDVEDPRRAMFTSVVGTQLQQLHSLQPRPPHPSVPFAGMAQSVARTEEVVKLVEKYQSVDVSSTKVGRLRVILSCIDKTVYCGLLNPAEKRVRGM